MIGFTAVTFECTGDRSLEEAVSVAARVKHRALGTVDVAIKDQRGGSCTVTLSWSGTPVPPEMWAELWRDVGASGG